MGCYLPCGSYYIHALHSNYSFHMTVKESFVALTRRLTLVDCDSHIDPVTAL